MEDGNLQPEPQQFGDKTDSEGVGSLDGTVATYSITVSARTGYIVD